MSVAEQRLHARWPELAGVFNHLLRAWDEHHQQLGTRPVPWFPAHELAQFAYRHVTGAPAWRPLLQVRAKRLYNDPMLEGLHRHRRRLLLFIVGAAVGLYEQDPDEGRALLHVGVELSRRVWIPSGPNTPEFVARRPIEAMREDTLGYERLADPTGDPEPEPGPTCTPEAVRDEGISAFYSIRMILDGIDHLEALVQTHFGLEVGDSRRDMRNKLERLLGIQDHPIQHAVTLWKQAA